jgi:hypothetical protein
METFKAATCHPKRRHYVKGLCESCYDKQRYRDNPKRKEDALRKAQLWYRDNREKVFYQGLWRKFKLSKLTYLALLAAQDGACAICKSIPPEGVHLQVDHDHKCCVGKNSCGKCIRGLLCLTCNYGLGQFNDSVEKMERVCLYLEAHQ